MALASTQSKISYLSDKLFLKFVMGTVNVASVAVNVAIGALNVYLWVKPEVKAVNDKMEF